MGVTSRGKGSGAKSMNLLHFFKPRTTSRVREIAVVDSAQRSGARASAATAERGVDGEVAAEEEVAVFQTPVKRPSEEGGAASDGELEQTPEQRHRGDGDATTSGGGQNRLARLGTPAQTYRRRKRPKVAEREEGGDGLVVGSEAERGPVSAGKVGTDSDKPRAARGDATKLRQAYLDLGQTKNFGHATCPVCGLLYTMGEPEDERTHKQFHRKFLAARERRANDSDGGGEVDPARGARVKQSR